MENKLRNIKCNKIKFLYRYLSFDIFDKNLMKIFLFSIIVKSIINSNNSNDNKNTFSIYVFRQLLPTFYKMIWNCFMKLNMWHGKFLLSLFPDLHNNIYLQSFLILLILKVRKNFRKYQRDFSESNNENHNVCNMKTLNKTST